jgi:hypothetical protein
MGSTGLYRPYMPLTTHSYHALRFHKYYYVVSTSQTPLTPQGIELLDQSKDSRLLPTNPGIYKTRRKHKANQFTYKTAKVATRIIPLEHLAPEKN